MKRRDLTEEQFLDALHRNGMTPDSFGYVMVTEKTSVSRHNGGDNRRRQLAYLIRRQAEIVAQEQAA